MDAIKIKIKIKIMNQNTNRRRFVKQTIIFAGAVAARPALHAAEANQKIILGVIGPGGMGMNHVRALVGYKDVEIAYVCDADENRLNSAATYIEKNSGKTPKAVKDMRRVFEDKAVDAVFIATPDHWHVPAALLALEAGKHVYVEKPCSHNIREGRLLVEAARRAKRVVQVGTQSRSADYLRRAMDLLHGGAIGDVLIAKAWNSQLRANIGHVKPSEPPAHLDFDLWVGPTPMVAYQSNLLPSSWRWFTAFGCGDAGNDGVHDIDIARWGLGVETHPNTVTALGGKYFFDDDQQFPDTQYVVAEYEIANKKKQLIYEHRIWSPYVQEGHENGNAFYGTKGMMILGKHKGWQLFGPRNKLVEEAQGELSLAAHHRNFFDSIRGGQSPHADARTGHLSAALAHFANIATRLGTTLKFDPAKEQFIGNEDANKLLRRNYREGHWAAPKGAV
jgi:predicted dehydrogenase